MGMGTSTFVIRWINFFTMLLAAAVICFGIWLSTHHDECKKSLTIPVMGLGAAILVISFIGFIGAMKNIVFLLWVYLTALCLILVAILVFTVSASTKHFYLFLVLPFSITTTKFVITNSSSGHTVEGLRYKEYHLQDYHSWFIKELNNTRNWNRLKSCIVKSDNCSNLQRTYKTLKEYKQAELTPIEAGCCRPPAECGYPPRNASYYDLSFHPSSSNEDCKLYKNSRNTKCYNCDSCKAGVAQYMRTEWRMVAIFNLFLFSILSAVYFVGCCARRNVAKNASKV